MCCLSVMDVFIFYVKCGLAADWGITAHSTYSMSSLYKYLIVILDFPNPQFVELKFLSGCSIF